MVMGPSNFSHCTLRIISALHKGKWYRSRSNGWPWMCRVTLRETMPHTKVLAFPTITWRSRVEKEVRWRKRATWVWIKLWGP